MKVLTSCVVEKFVVQIQHRTGKDVWFDMGERDSQSDAFATMLYFKSTDPERNWRVIRSVTAQITTEVGA